MIFFKKLTVINDGDEGVWNGENSALTVQRLARISSSVIETRVRDRQHTLAIFGAGETSRLLAHVAPI